MQRIEALWTGILLARQLTIIDRNARRPSTGVRDAFGPEYALRRICWWNIGARVLRWARIDAP
jgi:hypothetical protein